MQFLIFGTLWFYISVSISIALVFYFLESALTVDYKDVGGGIATTIVLLVFGALYFFFGSKQDIYDIGTFIKNNPGKIFLYALLYVLIGVVWSFVKWYFFLLNRRDEMVKEYLHNDGYGTPTTPTASKNKSRITTWMTYWPFSATWTLINQPIKRTFKFMYSSFEKLFSQMSTSMFSDLQKKVEEKNKIKEEERERMLNGKRRKKDQNEI